MAYIVNPKHMVANWRVLVVGVGGTGGYVAEGLCRLLAGSDIPLVLIDHDRVEPPNLKRQHFYAGDVGKFKSQVVAERLARQFGRPVGYSVFPYDSELIASGHGARMYTKLAQGIIIGCVDKAPARQSIANNFDYNNWWIDAGNGFSSGQVLIGNAKNQEEMRGSFDEESKEVERLPLPSLQVPSLLAPPTLPAAASKDCAESVAADEQSPVINQAMATLVLQFMYQFLNKKLAWMGAYIDLDAGSLQAVPAEPRVVSRMLGMKQNELMAPACSLGYRYSMRGVS